MSFSPDRAGWMIVDDLAAAVSAVTSGNYRRTCTSRRDCIYPLEVRGPRCNSGNTTRATRAFQADCITFGAGGPPP